MLDLNTSIEKISGIGPVMVKRLQKLGIDEVRDLLFHFPFRYDDFSKITPIIKVSAGNYCIRGKILEIKNERSPWRRIFLTHAVVQDDSASLKIIWYNQPYLTRTLKKGTQVILAGKIEYGIKGLTMSSPTWQKDEGQIIHVGRIVPVYPETEGLTSKWLRRIISPLLKLTPQIGDFLPEEIIKEEKFLSLSRAIRQIHFPDSLNEAKRAKERLSFDELFLLQLKVLLMKKKWQTQKSPKIKLDIQSVKNLVAKLPFKLTNAQRKSAWEILKDLEKSVPMNRLLEGDVGSGKTVVAAIAMLVVAKSGYQSVLMAPTEILAIQHFKNITGLLEDFGLRIGLLTSAKNELGIKNQESGIKKSELITKISQREVDIIIGTHALIQENLSFLKLGLAIVDEQHRFGVKQRALLRQKSKVKSKNEKNFMPHLLSMTATPIPRTLNLALYGDLDLSIIDEMPPGRRKIKTYLVHPEKRQGAYQFIRNQVQKGRQVFVICPLIEESDKLGVKSATQEYEKLNKEVFPDLKIGLLHGRMKTKEKEKQMTDFKAKKFDILVSTAVVEVGVDVQNATVMMIEGADRFGLAQLHQFRGRVGRAEHQSYCFLFTESPSAKTFKRLQALVKLDDGFLLAEKDLKLRGPGEVYGVRQHGLGDLKMASLMDVRLIERARKSAEKIIEKGLKNYPKLVERVTEYNLARRLE